MILFILSYLSAFILGMLIMGVLWYSKWEEIIANEKKISIKLYEENGDEFEQIIVPESIQVPLVIPPKYISFH